jgi:hypothetical protein
MLAMAPHARAQVTPVPDVVTHGLDLLVAGKRAEAVAEWSRGWEGDDLAKISTLSESLDTLGGLLGTTYGYELVKSFDISASLGRLYFVLRYQRAPLYVSFLVYRPDTTWMVTNVTWNTDGAAVFPKLLLEPAP